MTHNLIPSSCTLQGDILLFLTGEEEIEDVCRRVRTEAEGLGKLGAENMKRMEHRKETCASMSLQQALDFILPA